MNEKVKVARIYDPPDPGQGSRILVDRLWPRGISKKDAALDVWLKDVAPSSDLRRWYGHQSQRRTEFARRYESELDDDAHATALEQLEDLARKGTVTLLTATRDPGTSHVPIIVDRLKRDGISITVDLITTEHGTPIART